MGARRENPRARELPLQSAAAAKALGAGLTQLRICGSRCQEQDKNKIVFYFFKNHAFGGIFLNVITAFP